MSAVTIDDVITECANDIATLSYVDAVIGDNPKLAMAAWIAGMFGDAGVFPPDQDELRDPGQRVVTDWLAQHMIAQAEIVGDGTSKEDIEGTSAIIDAVFRVANAVKFATVNGFITSLQQTAVIALYNATWL